MFRRLNSLGICLSSTKTQEVVKMLGENHDGRLKMWQNAVSVMCSIDPDEVEDMNIDDMDDKSTTDNESDSDESLHLSTGWFILINYSHDLLLETICHYRRI